MSFKSGHRINPERRRHPRIPGDNLVATLIPCAPEPESYEAAEAVLERAGAHPIGCVCEACSVCRAVDEWRGR